MIDRLREIEARFDELTTLMASPDVVADPRHLSELGRELARLEPVVNAIRSWTSVRSQLEEAREMARDPDDEVRALAREEVATLEERERTLEQELRTHLIPRDPNDERDVILEVRAGTGGNEAALFAADLFRMYARYAERHGWKMELLSSSEGASGGFKEAIAEVRGEGAYSRLKFESGVHRVQRVPVTEAQGRIHTSTATVSVLPEAEEVEVDIPESDIRVDVYRSSGPGGQSVNTTDSAVRITHKPTGLVVAIQDEKSQHKNKAKAMAVLRARLLEMEQQRQAEERGEQRRSQVGTGERAEKIRTYNFPDDRVTDHRIGLTVHNLPGLLEGDLDRIIEPLMQADQSARLAQAGLDGDGRA
ncbi:MAG TPA: peptide chain release factor 1 [candidate division Zixibacteria bacterium]|nr:peptide chain release factor 1 [candidate division Zixibacteria bacterium]